MPFIYNAEVFIYNIAYIILLTFICLCEYITRVVIA